MAFLYDYQQAAVDRMKDGCILNGKVGSGKSRTALFYYFKENGGMIGDGEYQEMKDPLDLYIITTAKKRDDLDWQGEMTPFLMYPDNDISLYSNKIVIDSWNNVKKYANVEGAFFIFDEDRVTGKGPWVKQGFLKIAKKNRWILLTATPGDRWQDYWAVFVANGFYRNWTEFANEHITYKHFRNYAEIDHNAYRNTGKLLRLRRMITVQMKDVRTTQIHHIDIQCEYDKETYKRVTGRWNVFTDLPITNASEYCQCLRKVVNTDWSRMQAILDILEEKKKLIVFYNYDYELNLLAGYSYGDDVKVAQWNGKKHEPLPDGEKWVYLVQYNAGCEGWNCTKTDTLIFFSANYSYRIMTQAAGRIDRINTPFKDLYYYHLKSSSWIDISIERALKQKKKFNENAFFAG